MKRKALLWLVFSYGLLVAQAYASSWTKVAESAVRGLTDRSSTVNYAGIVEYGFSPGQGAESLVLKVINSARSEIRMMAYSLTSSTVVNALIDAKKRGVNVAVICDYKSNLQDDSSGKGRAALSALVNAGIPLRTTSFWPIHHDKVIVADRETVQTGSFNYSSSAANRNSENVLVVWKSPELARGYLEHFTSRYARGQDFTTRY